MKLSLADFSENGLVFVGGAIKATGNGKIEGYVAPFGSINDLDAQGEFFSANTDFDLESGIKPQLLLHHGMTGLKAKKIGRLTLSKRDGGIWGEGYVTTTTKAGEQIYADVVAGKMSFSSGSMPHVVQYKPAAKGREIINWPIGEVSLTPSPVNQSGAARAFAMKGLEIPESVKGMFQEMVDAPPSRWKLNDFFEQAICKIDAIEDASELMGQDVDVKPLIKEAVAEYAASLLESVYHDFDIEETQEESVKALITLAQVSAPIPRIIAFEEHARIVQDAMKAFSNRMKIVFGFDAQDATKAKRLTAKRREKMETARNSAASIAQELTPILEETTPVAIVAPDVVVTGKSLSKEQLEIYHNSVRMRAEQYGVNVQ